MVRIGCVMTLCCCVQVTVDAREGISTGISAEDRARTLRLLADPAASAGDFRRPGHINPLRCCSGVCLLINKRMTEIRSALLTTLG